MDGWITIGTKLDTDKFDKQLRKLEKDIEKEENKKITVETKLGTQEQDLEDQRKKVDELATAYQRLKQVQKNVSSGKATPQQFAELTDLKSQYGDAQKLEATFDKALSKQTALEQKVQTTKMQYNEISNKVNDYKQKVESIKFQKQQSDINKVKEGFKGVGSSLQNAVRKASQLVLGIFAIRSAYNFLRSASSELSQYDSQYKANIDYIRFALTQMVAPILKYIVNLAGTLLNYINMIAKAWFGVNLFQNAGVNAFKNMKSGANGTTKAVKELKKQLAGFDEMNVLSDTSSGGSTGGNTGIATPSFELGGDMGGNIPPWMQWVLDNKDLLISAIAGITAGLVAFKLTTDGILSLGIGLIIAGIVELVQGIIDFIKDPSWDNFAKILQGLAILLAGVAVAMLAVNSANPIAWIILVIAAIVAVTSAVIKNWDKVKEVAGKIGQWIYDHIIQPIVQYFSNLWEKLKTGVTNLWNGIVSILSNVTGWVYGRIIAPVVGFFNNLWNGIKNGANTLWNGIKSIFGTVGSFFTSVFQSAYNGITRVFSGIRSFFSNIWNTIKSIFTGIGSTVGDAIGGAFRNAINGVLRIAESVLNTPIRAINNLISTVNTLPGVNIGRLSTFNLPRLKTGGIINMPNKGINVGGAIAGESGKEGVIPLTDSQAMETLGEAIGRYITINANITNNMNGRVISREVQKIQNDRNFAYNS